MRNPRTNPFGKYISAFFNYRTELLPIDSFRFGWVRTASALSFWAFLTGGGYYTLNQYTETQHWNNEASYQAMAGGATRNNPIHMPEYPADAPQHLEAITPMKNFISARPDMVFGPNKQWMAGDGVHTQYQTVARNLEDAIDSSFMQGGADFNVHRYVKAKPLEDYEAIRLKGLFNLAAAAYYEGRAPAFFQPLAHQAKIDQANRSSIV